MTPTKLTMETQEYLPACPICKSPARPWAAKKYGSDIYTIDRCSECGYAFVNPRPSMNFLKAHYSNFGHGAASNPPSLDSVLAAEAVDPNSTIDAKRIIATIKQLLNDRHDMSGRFLDVGAGYGFFSKEARQNDFQVVAIDLAKNENQISRSISGIDPISTTFEDVVLEPSSLSVVLMSQVLEHALDVNVWVAKAWQLLENDGILAIALPNFGSLQRMIFQEKEPYVCPPDHLNFFTPGALCSCLKNNGFVVETIQHVSRVPRGTIQRRVPRRAAPLVAPLSILVQNLLRLVDVMRLGSIINVYARKVSISSSARSRGSVH